MGSQYINLFNSLGAILATGKMGNGVSSMCGIATMERILWTGDDSMKRDLSFASYPKL